MEKLHQINRYDYVPVINKTVSQAVVKGNEDNIFANMARKNGMDSLANFLSDDWSANMARKAGWNNFADWIDNKENLENPNAAKKESFINKGLRAMVKHPVLTLATIATVAFCGVKLYNHFNKASQGAAAVSTMADDTVKVIQTPPKATVKPPVELEPTAENIKILTEKINAGLAYEKEIGYSNLEILKDLSATDRKRITNYLDIHYEDSKNFIYFATGEVPATLQCLDSYRHDLYDHIRSDRINVAEFFWDKGGDLLINREAAKKVVADNLELFQNRLGLPNTTTAQEIEKLISKSSGSPLRVKEKYDDLVQLMLGNDIDDACHAQIVKDIKNQFDSFFYPGKAKTLEDYKAILKRSVLNKKSSYSTMSESFRENLLKKIDTFSQSSFDRIVSEPIEVFQNPKSELIEFRRMVSLAEKLENAQKFGTMLKLN